MFPIKKQFREHHINKPLVFRKGQRFGNAVVDKYTHIHTQCYQELIPTPSVFQIGVCSAQTWREVKNLMAELGEKAPEVFHHHPDPRTPQIIHKPGPHVTKHGLAKTGIF